MEPAFRRHAAEVEATAIARLSAAEAHHHDVHPDDPRADQIHEWAARLPHDWRLQRLYELGVRTDDLWLGVGRS